MPDATEKRLVENLPDVVWTPGPTPAEQRGKKPGVPTDLPDGVEWHASLVNAFQPADYTFMMTDFSITSLRAAHRDTDFLGETVVVDGQAPVSLTSPKLGDLDTGNFPQGTKWALGPVHVDDPAKGVVFHYTITNTGHADWKTIDDGITALGVAAAGAGAKAITGAGGAIVGATVGGVVLPVFGAAIGLALGWAVGKLTGLFVANCDGVVADVQLSFSGQTLWTATEQGGGRTSGVAESFGGDTPSGCGANSHYTTQWQILRS